MVGPFLEVLLYIEIIIGPYYYAYKDSYNRNIGLQSVTEMVEQHVIISIYILSLLIFFTSILIYKLSQL